MTVQYYMEEHPLLGKSELREASREELAVLIALRESDGCADTETFSALLGISAPRVAGALAYWEAAGVIGTDAGKVSRVENEFASRVREDGVSAESGAKTAQSIRDSGLGSLIEECARMLGVSPTALSRADTAGIVGLYTQYKLPEDFIITVLSDLCSKGKASVKRLCDTCVNLYGKGIDNTADLCDYYREREGMTEGVRTVCAVLGIRKRALSAEEKELFKKWTGTFGYTRPILDLAYSITVRNTGSASTEYLDRVLTNWYEGGVKTPEDAESFGAGRITDVPTAAAPARSGRKARPEKPRYGNFDPEEAFLAALERSYGELNDESTTDENT